MSPRIITTSLWFFVVPLVVAFEAVEQCNAVLGCAQQASSLLQSTGLSSMTLTEVQGSSVQESLVSADDFVTHLAQRVIGHNIPLTAEETTALKTIEDFITRLLVEAELQHAADQQRVNGAFNVMDQCNTDADTSLQGEVDDYLEDVVEARGAHSACRSLQKTDNGTMDTACHNYTQYRMLSEAAKPPQCMEDTHLALDYVKTSNKEHQKLMEACLSKTKLWLDPLYTRYVACKDAIGGVDTRKADCDLKQTKFELDYCEYVDKHDDACSALDTCMSNGRTNRDDVHASVKEAESARMGDWSAARHIECLFDVFKVENKDKNSTFTKCRGETYDTAKLKIVYPDEPVPVPCAQKTSKPCGGTWLSTEYTTQPWHDKAPTAECSSCVTPPVALPITYASTCATDGLAADERVVFFLHDDDNTNDLPDDSSDVAAGFRNDNAFYIGNQNLSAMTLTGLRMCLENSGTSDCDRLCYTVKTDDFTYTGPGVPAGMTNFQKAVVGLTGQLGNQVGSGGNKGKIIKTHLNTDVECPGVTASTRPTKCWTCIPAGTKSGWGWIVPNLSADWHVIGYGMSLSRSNHGMDELYFWTGGACGDQKHYDNFYLVAQGSFPVAR